MAKRSPRHCREPHDLRVPERHTLIDRGAKYAGFRPTVRPEMAVACDRSEKVVDAITAAAGARQIQDGTIFLTTLDHVMRMRTGETGSDAL
jgi:nitrogen regulatory protein PII